jgi:hypothetical protein
LPGRRQYEQTLLRYETVGRRRRGVKGEMMVPGEKDFVA